MIWAAEGTSRILKGRCAAGAWLSPDARTVAGAQRPARADGAQRRPAPTGGGRGRGRGSGTSTVLGAAQGAVRGFCTPSPPQDI